jgi:hypothetical protein
MVDRQGDPLSPILFNIVADMLAIMIERAKSDGQFEGVIPHLVDGGLSILQYADDTILFMEHDLEKAKNLKLILLAFEHLSGLKINFHKSELFFLARPKIRLIYMPSFLDAIKVNFQLGIWVSQFIFADLQMLNGKLLRKYCSYV